MTQVRWGLLSTAAIGATVVDACRGSATVRFAAVEAADRICVEGFMWRHHPQTEYARRLVAEGAIGRDDTVAQAAVLEALATSARAGKPIEPRRSGATA